MNLLQITSNRTISLLHSAPSVNCASYIICTEIATGILKYNSTKHNVFFVFEIFIMATVLGGGYILLNHKKNNSKGNASFDLHAVL